MYTWYLKGTSTKLGFMKETTGVEPPHHSLLTAPHRELIDQVLDKWSLLVLENLCERTCRFNDLRREIPPITQKSLTTTLRRLERNGMVERMVVSTRPVAVEYRITALGKTLQDVIDALFEWTTASLPAVEGARKQFDNSNS